MESGELPSPRFGLRAATIDNVIFVTGGQDDNQNPSTAILSWDPPSESWKPAGDLKKARYYHAVVAITSSIIESECSDMLNCKINGTVHIFFLKKSYLSPRCPKLAHFFFLVEIFGNIYMS